MSGDIIILHMCTKNSDQMMYGSSDMVQDRQTDGQTDKKSDMKTWVPHLKIDKTSKNCHFWAYLTPKKESV